MPAPVNSQPRRRSRPHPHTLSQHPHPRPRPGQQQQQQQQHAHPPGCSRPIKHVAPKGESATAEYNGWAISRVGLGRLMEDSKTFSLEWGLTLGRKGRFEIQHDRRRLCVVLKGARAADTVQLFVPLHSIREVLGLEDRSSPDLVFVLRHAFHIDYRGERQEFINDQHRNLGQVVNLQLLVSFKSDEERSRFISEPLKGTPDHQLTKVQVTFGGVYAAERMKQVKLLLEEVSSVVAFQLHALVLAGLVTPEQLLDKLAYHVKNVELDRGAGVAERVLVRFGDILRRLDRFRQHRLGSDEAGSTKSVISVLKQANKGTSDTVDGSLVAHLVQSRFAIITPTAMDLEGPIVEQGNATVRLYGPHSDNFLRVSFKEEDHSQLFASSMDWNVEKFLQRRCIPIFEKGVVAGNKRFEFLGWSSAGFKEQTAIFVAPFVANGKLRTAETIRRDFGDFSSCLKIPSKWMARVSQNFSTTQHGAILHPHEWSIIPDIERPKWLNPKEKWNFTDGVGSMSPTLAAEIQDRLEEQMSPYARRRQIPGTCFQIRLGGAKGMLVVDPFLTGRQVKLRKSMLKFDVGGSLTLDIANTFGRPISAFTNRPLIQILEGRGVSKDAFLELQKALIERTLEAKTTLKAAVKLLETNELGQAARLDSTLAWLATLFCDDNGDWLVTENRFMRQSIDLATSYTLRQIKFRGRMPLGRGGYNLVGVADEEPGGYLKPGEIYACIHEPGKEPVYLQGDVAISRSPTIHPGDVQRVRAIGKLPPGKAPRIAYQKNCVVFSVQGSRPLCSMLGGGDLDGDLYHIITQPSLIPPAGLNHPPGAYTDAKPVELDRDATIADAAKFFVRFVASNCVGQISTRHMHLADKLREGIFSRECLALAEYSSHALDYPKSGREVNFALMPEAPFSKPDFMATERVYDLGTLKPWSMYASQKVLGKLYRAIGDELIQLDGLEEEGQAYIKDDRLDPGLRITRALKKKLKLFTTDQTLQSTLNADIEPFTDELHRIARMASLEVRALSEYEVLLGSIAAGGASNKHKSSAMDRLAELTEAHFAKCRILLNAGEQGEDRLRRLWAAWNAAIARQTEWGVATFGWIVLGEMREALEDGAASAA